MRDFRKLTIWRDSLDFSVDIISELKKFPDEEKYGLTRQISRCSVSIPSNIAEGCRGTNSELSHFLSISLGSAFELETQLEIAMRVGYMSKDRYEVIIFRLRKIQASINAYRSKVKYG